MYRVLRPKLAKTGESTQTPDGLIRWWGVEWVDIGPADSIEDAKRRYGAHLPLYGGAPVLAYFGRPH